MKIFGYELNVRKAPQTITGNGGWFPLVREASAGAWQRGESIDASTALSHSAVFACVALIASDVGKLPVQITQRQTGYWAPVEHPLDALLRRPNNYQNRAQFIGAWIASKLLHGNAYVLKVRSASGMVHSLHVLDPKSVNPLVADDGAVFYRLGRNPLAGLHEEITLPARELIHDRGFTPLHPLLGVSPISAAALAAEQGIAIQTAATAFFKNGARSSVLITAPGAITQATADTLRTHWAEGYSGANTGRPAVLSDGMSVSQLTMSSTDAQLLEQMNWTAQDVCRAFRVPAWKIGAGPSAPYTNNEATNLTYYSDCLQPLIESLELGLDDGLSLPTNQRTELDLDHLLRMDTSTRYAAYATAIGAGFMQPNEARRKESLPPVPGGDTCYLQQQYFSLAELAARQSEGGQA